MSASETAQHQEALGQSDTFLEFQEKLSKVAPIDRPVLLLGERGTGKELAASRLHFLSKRWQGPFITLNCSTLSPTLIESELFGYEKGAFTGAEKRRAGRFEAAHGGTLFLDEIGSIPMIAQEKILRVVEYASFERVGSSASIEVDVRIVCATNANLVTMTKRGEFKRDLLDRLSFEVLYLPPLRHRGEDILLLANHFAARMALELGIEVPRFSHRAQKALYSHPWEGNIRELKNVVERAVYKADSLLVDDIRIDPFTSPFDSHKREKSSDEIGAAKQEKPFNTKKRLPFKEAVKAFEVEILQKALSGAQYNQKKAADALQLSYDQFRGLMRKHKKDLA